MRYFKKWYNYYPTSLAGAAILSSSSPCLIAPTDTNNAEISSIAWFSTILLFIKHLCKLNPNYNANFQSTLQGYISGILPENNIDTDPAQGSRENYQCIDTYLKK